jgi:PAS domain S-box-containing protein
MRGSTADGGSPIADDRPAPLRATVLANLGQAVAAVAPEDGVVLWANAACERLFGYGIGGLEGRHLSDISAASVHSPGARAAAIEHELARAGVWSGATDGVRRDGSTFPCIASFSEIVDDRTSRRVWAAVFLAAGQPEGAEEHPLAVRRLTELVFEGASAAMAVVGTDLRVAEGNRAFLELTGRSYHEVVGQPISGVIHPDHVAPLLDRLHALLADDVDFVRGESRLLTGDRHEVPIGLTAALVCDLDRRPLYALLFLEARSEP